MKNAWVIGSTVSRSFLGLTEKADMLAHSKGQTVRVLIVGEELSATEAGMLTDAGAVEVVHIPADPEDLNAVSAVLSVLVRLFGDSPPSFVLFESSACFSLLAPAFACAVRCGITADCTDLALDGEGHLLMIRPAFGGRELATNWNTSGTAIATVRKGVFQSASLSPACNAEILRLPSVQPGGPWTLIRKLTDELSGVDLCGASVIISGGLGMKTRENYRRLFQLASLTGAAVGASRAAVAAGFAGYEHQVGQTGVSVHPDLYIAFGISGAVQHLSGITGAQRIVAVNTDSGAPIHEFADLSIVADCSEVLDRILQRIATRKPS